MENNIVHINFDCLVKATINYAKSCSTTNTKMEPLSMAFKKHYGIVIEDVDYIVDINGPIKAEIIDYNKYLEFLLKFG